jgi:hypothetical protein
MNLVSPHATQYRRYLQRVAADDALYLSYFEWKSKPYPPHFKERIEHCAVRLSHSINQHRESTTEHSDSIAQHIDIIAQHRRA